jgi:hypothetical protein
LLIDVCGITFIIFEGHAERFGVVSLAIAEHQIHEHFLDLIKDVFINCFWVVGRIFREKEASSELFNHKYLLEKTVHVTNTSQVFETCVTCGRLKSLAVGYCPVL